MPNNTAPEAIIYFGGSFDPPHKGHLALAEAALAQLPQAQLLIMPTGDASSYKSRRLSPPEQRLALCELAFAALPRCHISRLEAFSQQANYTIDTLAALQAERQAQGLPPAQWWLLLGADQMAELHRWHRWQELVQQVHVLLAWRTLPNAEQAQQAQRNWAACPQGQRLEAQAPTLSSTQVRELLAQGHQEQAASFLAPAVLRYIGEHSLYQDTPMATEAKNSKTSAAELFALQTAVINALEDGKAIDIQVFDTEKLSPLFERVIVASGRSNRQTRALASHVSKAVKDQGQAKPRIEGEENGEWVIVDCGSIVCHIFQPLIRNYYNIEEVWGEFPISLEAAKAQAPSKKPAVKKAAAKKVAAKKVPAKKAAAKKASGSKVLSSSAAPAKKTAVKKVAAKKAPAKKAAAKKTAAKKA